jgi:diguanylate cyclase (GGDEF)-like protein
MERFVRIAAPVGGLDFLVKFAVCLLICGLLNHIRDIVLNAPEYGSFVHNFGDAAFTAVPMCAFALLLIAHLNKLQRSLHIQAMRDDLTGLRNRRWFMEHCPDQFGKDDVLMLCDIDHFKRINDVYGHHMGDLCLRQFSDHLQSILPDHVSAARIGGEEFGILLHGQSDARLKMFADLITMGVQLETPDGANPTVTASVGMMRSQTVLPCKTAFALADEALYMAKKAGRARYRMVRDVPASKATGASALSRSRTAATA